MNVKDVVARPRKIALYVSTDLTDYYYVREINYAAFDEHYNPLPEGQLREVPSTTGVRISEPIDITFSAISSEEIVAKAVESLNEQERKLIDELNAKIASIREKKSQLLALTHQTESA